MLRLHVRRFVKPALMVGALLLVSLSLLFFLHSSARKPAAVCVFSDRLDALKKSGSSIKANLVDALQADVFVVGTQPRSLSRRHIEAMLGPSLQMHIVEQPSLDEVTRKLEGVPILKSLRSTNTFHSAEVLTSFWREACINVIHAAGSYEWIVLARSDMQWLAPHPPLRLLRNDSVYVADLNHWRGVQHSHLTVPTGPLLTFATFKWTALLSGRLSRELTQRMASLRALEASDGFVAEQFSLWLAEQLHIPLGVFRGVSALVCTTGETTNTFNRDKLCPKGAHWKYTCDEKNSRDAAKDIVASGWKSTDICHNCTASLKQAAVKGKGFVFNVMRPGLYLRCPK